MMRQLRVPAIDVDDGRHGIEILAPRRKQGGESEQKGESASVQRRFAFSGSSQMSVVRAV
jgi:hypothetical protein